MALSSQLARALILFLFVTGSNLWAKDLTNRLGVGYMDSFSDTLPSIAVRYYPSSELGVAAALGIDTRDENSRFGFMAKIYKILFIEDNMNFYMGSGVGLISVENDGDNNSGFEINGYAGAEFFFTGLDSLGLSFETGIGVTSVSSEVRFRTIGDSPIRAGMIFYF